MTPEDHGDWKSYHENVADQILFHHEAFDFVSRLGRMVPLSQSWKVFDFGCGFGHVADAIADKVREVHLWDEAENMRRHAADIADRRANVRLLNGESGSDLGIQTRYDLILVNSVVQYMSPLEFTNWLVEWRSLLRPGGRIILSDIIPRKMSPIIDLIMLINFCIRKGILIQAVREGFKMMKDWGKIQTTLPLQYFSRQDIVREAEEAGFVVRIFERNLTFRQSRFSVQLTMA